MSPDKQRVAIAEACGWKGIDSRRWGGYTDTYQSLCSPSDAVGAKGKYWGYIPDYLSDLNAMHEAILSLPDYQYRAYCVNIIAICKGQLDALKATASEQAEAFLRAKLLWTP